MAAYGYFVDLTICAGCEACTVACQNKNGLLPEQVFTRVQRFETGTYPHLASAFVTTQCMHCDDPPCARVCPTGATHKSAPGPVVVDELHCINCRYCMGACPYGARVADESERVVRKCSFCLDRLIRGEQPACVQTCLTGARIAGDLDDPASPIHAALNRPGVVAVEGTSFYYRLPPQIDRSVLPANFQAAGVTFAWQSVIQPLGQWMLGGVAGALLVSMAANAIGAAQRKEGGTASGHH